MKRNKSKTLIISFSDVKKHPWYNRYKDSESGLKALLYSMGMDVGRHFSTNICQHRPNLSNKVVNCPRYVGKERDDENWSFIKRAAQNFKG